MSTMSTTELPETMSGRKAPLWASVYSSENVSHKHTNQQPTITRMEQQQRSTGILSAFDDYMGEMKQAFSHLSLTDGDRNAPRRRFPPEIFLLIIKESVEPFTIKSKAGKGPKIAGQTDLVLHGVPDMFYLKLVCWEFYTEVKKAIRAKFDGQLTLAASLAPRLEATMFYKMPSFLVLNVTTINICFGVGPRCDSELFAVRNLPRYFPFRQTINVTRFASAYQRKSLEDIDEGEIDDLANGLSRFAENPRRKTEYTEAMLGNRRVNISYVLLYRDGKLYFKFDLTKRNLRKHCIELVEFDD